MKKLTSKIIFRLVWIILVSLVILGMVGFLIAPLFSQQSEKKANLFAFSSEQENVSLRDSF